MGSVSATPGSAVEVLGCGASSLLSGSGTSSLEASLLFFFFFFFFLGGPAGSSPSGISAISSASSPTGRLEPRGEEAGVPPEAPVGCTAPTKLGKDTGSPCGHLPPEPGSLPEDRSRTAAWSLASMSCRAFSCRSCMSKMRLDACILQALSFFPEERLSGTGAALMGVLVTSGVMSVGSPSPVRSYVGAQLWKMAHLEPAGRIPRGHAPSEAVLWVDEAFMLCGTTCSVVPVPRLPECPASGTVPGCPIAVFLVAADTVERAAFTPVQAMPGMIRHMLCQRDCWTR